MHYYIYGKPGCSYCIQAKTLLESRNIPFSYRELDRESLLELVAMTDDQFGVRPHTVPIVYKGSRFIGGLNELKTAVDQEQIYLKEG